MSGAVFLGGPADKQRTSLTATPEIVMVGATHGLPEVGEACRRCGGDNVIWSAQSPLWNYVMRGNDINGEPLFHDLVCIPCFIVLAQEAGLPARGWRLTLTPEPEGLVYTTPSGRVWDESKYLWVEPCAVANAYLGRTP